MHRVVLAAVLPPTFTIFLLLVSAIPAHAIELAYSHRGLVTDSDVIIIATLGPSRGEMKYGKYVEEGWLRVERVLCGDVKVGQLLLLRWANFPDVACPRVEHMPNQGKSLLWFLRRDDGVYRADTNQRAWPIEEVETIIDTLAAYPYYVVTPRYDIGERVTVTIEFRNGTPAPLSVPTLRVVDGRVTFSRGFELVLHPRYSMGVETPVVLRPGSLERDEHLAPTTLAPGEVSRVELPFSDLISEMSVGLYRFDVRVNGGRTTHGVRVQTEWETALDRVRDTPAEIPFYIRSLRAGGPGAEGALMALQIKRVETARFADELMGLCDSLETSSRTQLMRMITWLDIPPEDQMDFYLHRTNDPLVEVRASAGHSIGIVLQSSSYRRNDAVTFLLAMLDGQDPMPRQAVISTINNARVVEALPSLKIVACNDPDREVRRTAWWTIDVLEGRRPCNDRKGDK